MNAVEGSKLTGYVLIEMVRDGEVIDRREFHNLITTVGKAWMTGALSGGVASPETMKYIGVGTGTTAAAAGDTALETPVETRATGTQSLVTTTTTDDTYQVVGTVTFSTARAVTECGLFSASTSGTIMARKVFDVMNCDASVSLQFTWQIKQA